MTQEIFSLSNDFFVNAIQHLADTMGIGIIMLDGDLKVRRINGPGTKLLGLSAEFCLHKPISEVFTSLDIENSNDLIHSIRHNLRIQPQHIIFHGPREIKYINISSFSDSKQSGTLLLLQDESERRHEQLDLSGKLALEKAISTVSRILIESGDVDACLKEMGQFANSNRAYIFYLREDGKFLDNLYEWCDEETEPQIEKLQNIPSDAFPWWMKQLRDKKNILISDVSRMPAEAHLEQQLLKEQDILSLLVVPLFNQQELMGFVGFDDTQKTREWTPTEIEFLRIMAEMIASFKDRNRAEKKYRELTKTYQSLAEAANDLIFIIDKNDTVTYLNNYAARRLGKKVSDVVGRKRSTLFPNDKEQKKFIDQVLKTGRPLYSERKLHFPGMEVWLGTSFVPLKNSESEVYACLGVARDITEKIHAQQELRHRTEEYQLLVEHTSDLVIKVTRENIIQYVSPRYCETFGKTKEELIGKTFWPLVHEDDREKTKLAMKKLFAPPYSCYVEQRVKTVKGWRWVGWADCSVLDSNGDIESIIGVGRDVTERVAAQQALKENEKRYRSLFNNLNDAVIIMDKDKIIESNPAALELFQISHKEIINKYFWDLSPEYQPDGVPSEELAKTKIKAALRGANQAFEWVHKKSSGEPFFAEVNLNRIKLAGKWHLLAQVRDISQRIAHQKALRESEEQYRNLFNSATEAIFILDRDKIIDCNPQAARMFGLDRREIIGKTPWQIFPTDPSEGTFFKLSSSDRLQRVLIGEDQKFVWVHQKPDGEPMYVEMKMTLTFIRGEPKILAMGGDITDRIQSENLLKESEQRFRETIERSLDGFFAIDIEGNLTLLNTKFEEMFGLIDCDAKGRPFVSIISQSNRDHVSRILKTALSGKPIRWEEFCEQRTDGSKFWVAITARRVIKNGVVVGVEGFVKNITEHKKAEEALVQSEAGYRSLFQGLPNEVFSLDRDGIIRNANNKFMERWGKKVVGKNIEKAFKSPRVRQLYYRAFKEVIDSKTANTFDYSFKLNKTKYQVRSILEPILVDEKELIGIVGINIDMTELIDALNRSKSYASRLVEIQEEERGRISREIHDSLGGYLSGIQLELANIRNAVERNDLLMAEKILTSSKETINEAIRSAHELCHDLRPHLLDDFGLFSALRQYIFEVSKRSRIKARFHHNGTDSDLPSSHQLALFRFVQEALTNVLRHSNASMVDLQLEINNDCVRFSVEDNGTGFAGPVKNVKMLKKFGLINMQERMELLNGILTIQSRPDQGTIISAYLPLNGGEKYGH